MAEKNRKPLLFGTDYAEDLERVMSATDEMQNDPGWIPGYSEAVRAQELSKVDPTRENFTTHRGIKTKDGKQLRDHYLGQFGEPKPLPVRLKWVRVVGMDGAENQNVRTDMIKYWSDGYRPVTLDELKKYGFGMPPAGTVAADGTIRRGDVALMAVDAERARAIDLRRAAENAEREAAAASDGIDFERSRESNYVI